MKMSEKRRCALYAAIHTAVTDVRIELGLEGRDDYTLAQVERKIWNKQKEVLGLEPLKR